MKLPGTDFKKSEKQSGAFTLKELLVVIATVAILACLHVSAHTGLKDQTRIAQCSGNLKQLNLAFQIYGEENHDQLPANPAGSESWAWDLPFAAGNILSQWMPTNRFYCPGTSDRFTDKDDLNLWNFGVNSFHT